jgi:hypothetical protein
MTKMFLIQRRKLTKQLIRFSSCFPHLRNSLGYPSNVITEFYRHTLYMRKELSENAAICRTEEEEEKKNKRPCCTLVQFVFSFYSSHFLSSRIYRENFINKYLFFQHVQVVKRKITCEGKEFHSNRIFQ